MIDVRYRCNCGVDAIVSVTERTKNQDVGEWMGVLRNELAADHVKRSPLCNAEKMIDVAIPFEEGAPVGAKATRQ